MIGNRGIVSGARWRAMNRTQYLQQFVDETEWYNSIVLGVLLPESIWRPLPSLLKSWLRNYIGGTLLYLVSGFLWCFYIYHLKRNAYIPKGFCSFLFLLSRPVKLCIICLLEFR